MRAFAKPLLLAALAAAFALAGGAYARQAPEKYREISAHLAGEGFAALEQGKVDAAITAFEQAMVANPANVEVYIGLGEAYYRAGSFGFSARYYDNALQLDPINRRALAGQGLAWLAMDSPERARANLEKLRTICGDAGCAEAARLAGEIAGYSENNS